MTGRALSAIQWLQLAIVKCLTKTCCWFSSFWCIKLCLSPFFRWMGKKTVAHHRRQKSRWSDATARRGFYTCPSAVWAWLFSKWQLFLRHSLKWNNCSPLRSRRTASHVISRAAYCVWWAWPKSSSCRPSPPKPFVASFKILNPL